MARSSKQARSLWEQKLSAWRLQYGVTAVVERPMWMMGPGGVAVEVREFELRRDGGRCGILTIPKLPTHLQGQLEATKVIDEFLATHGKR